MPGQFGWGSAKIVKRYGGAATIADNYSFDLTTDFHLLAAELENGDPNQVTLKLRIDSNETFLLANPILNNESAKWNYLLEIFLTSGKNNIDSGKFFRCRIKNATKMLDDKYGLLLNVTCEGLEVRLRETAMSNPQIFRTAAYAMTKYMTEYNEIAEENPFQEKLIGYGGLYRGHVISLGLSTVILDDSASLRQNWVPGGVRTYYDMFEMMIKKMSLSQPQGGINKEYYMDFDYTNTPGFRDKRYISVTAKEFASEDSGITINPISFSNPENRGTESVDNEKYYDKVILECDSTSASLPMDRTRILSALEHGNFRDEYKNTKKYLQNDVVKQTDTTNKKVRYFKSKLDKNTAALPSGAIPASNSSWEEDVHRSNLISPLTNNLEIWKANISAFKNAQLGSGFTDTAKLVSASSGFIGGFPDPNFVRVNYDRGDLDYYYSITLKDLTRIATNNSGIPTGDEIYDGQRFLIGQNKNANITTAPFASHKQKIAEYDEENQEWKFSKNPEAGDVISDHSTMRMYQYTGTYPNGKWKILWDINQGGGWQTSPWHPLKSMKLTTDSNGVKDAAVEFTYDWNSDLLTGGDARNRYSRGWWLAFYHPLPRKYISAEFPIGKIFKKPFLDINNMRYATNGKIGYNDIHGEDHGLVSGLRLTLTSSIQDSSNNNLDFKANQKVIFWVLDKFGRIFTKDEEIRANGKPETFVVGFGASSEGNELWTNRVDDLREIYGLTIPAFFGLKEEERHGISFDWNWIRGWGIFYGDAYNDNPKYYTAGANSYIDDIAGRVDLVKEYLLNAASSLFAQSDTGPAIVLAGQARLKIEDLHYIKQLIVMSDDAKLKNPHTKILQDQNETDYNNAKITARSHREKGKVFRPIRHITSDLDVRLRKGMKFRTSDGREWGAITVKQIINDDGATMEIAAIPKLVF